MSTNYVSLFSAETAVPVNKQEALWNSWWLKGQLFTKWIDMNHKLACCKRCHRVWSVWLVKRAQNRWTSDTDWCLSKHSVWYIQLLSVHGPLLGHSSMFSSALLWCWVNCMYIPALFSVFLRLMTLMICVTGRRWSVGLGHRSWRRLRHRQLRYRWRLSSRACVQTAVDY